MCSQAQVTIEESTIVRDPQWSDDALMLIAGRFKLLAEPTRLRLLYLLMDSERTVTELVQCSGMAQAHVSHQLGLLADSGLVARRRDGGKSWYRLADRTVVVLSDLVCAGLQQQAERVADATISPADR